MFLKSLDYYWSHILMSNFRILIDAHDIIERIRSENLDPLLDIGVTLKNVCEKAMECIINTRAGLNPDTAHLSYDLYEFKRSFDLAVTNHKLPSDEGTLTARYNTLRTMYSTAITIYYQTLIRALPRVLNLKEYDKPSYYVTVNDLHITGTDDSMLIDFTIDYLPF